MTLQFLTPQHLHDLLESPVSTEPPPARLNSPILGLLASADREIMADMITECSYPPGTIIFNEGDVGDALYIIRSGRVVVVKGGFQTPIILGYRGTGEIIGEMALLEDKPRSASVVAVEEVRLLKVSREKFQSLRDNSPIFEMDIAKALSARLRAADEAREEGLQAKQSLSAQLSALQTEKEQLLELQRLRVEASDFMVHDLRNPLSLVSGALNVLEMTLPPDILQANREIFNLATINCQRLNWMIDSLLDIARMEAGETALLLTEVNLAELVENVTSRLKNPAEIKSLSLSTAVPTDLFPLKADREKIERVLTNLIDNAIKFTPAGGQITVSVEAQAEQWIVRVINTGPIIPPANREHIFERFVRLSGETLRTRGSGLGLAFCRLAVEAHGGRIWVEPDANGQGNSFTFTLPRT